MDKLVIKDADCIRGNIFLPDTMDGAKIFWKSSNPSIISDADRECIITSDTKPFVKICGEVKNAGRTIRKGVVSRTETDQKVTLSATINLLNNNGGSCNGVEVAKKDIDVIVKAKPKSVRDEEYVGYLFGHFIGEETENSEQIYFSLSEGGLHFKDLNNEKPVLRSDVGEKGVRDPYICRSFEGDRYFLIATDLSIYHRGGWFKNEQGYYDPSTTGSQYLVFWESTDLVNWGEPRLLDVAPTNAGMAWAPEMIYSEETGEYIIFFASSIMNTETKLKDKPNAIYYVATRDFVNFSETKILIDNQTDEGDKPREIIDTTILRIGSYYYSVSKDGDNEEACGGIRIMKTQDLFDSGSWVKVLDLDELGLGSIEGKALDNGLLEGPELFIINKADRKNPKSMEYGIIADQYAIGAGYLPIVTTDIEDVSNSNNSWTLLSEEDYSFDKLKKRHGTIIRITQDEIDRLKNFYC